MEEIKKARNSQIDFYKGLLMLGVVWGHTITIYLNGELNTM